MSAWPSQPSRLSSWRRWLGVVGGLDLPVVSFLGAALLVRVLTDDLASPDSRQSGSLDLSGGIAVLFILVAIALLLRRRKGVLPTALAALWLCVWMGIAAGTHGTSTETLREGVREGSVLALAVIVYNARGAVTVSTATRLVQLVGLAPALLALYQLATHTGMDIAGNLRSNGTFAHPDSAAMFFAIAATASLWRYLDDGRRRSDALLTTLFAAAVITTLSLDGLAALAAMLIALGALRPGPFAAKLGPCLIAGLVLLAFLATPLGAQRIAKESSTSLATADRGEADTSLDWRLHKWQTLLPEWEASPLVGQGLGTTTTTEAVPGNRFSGKPPHNEYVRYLVETGVIGLAILLAALTILIRNLLRRRRIPGTLDEGTLNAPALAIVIIVGCLVNALADNTFLNSPTCYAAALIVVAILSLPGVETQRAAIPQTT
jgi:O-antigen ligase